MFAIDCHCHIYNHEIAPRAVSNVGQFYNINMNCGGTAEELTEMSKISPIKKFVVNAVALTPKPVYKLNEYIAAECKKHNEFIGVGTLHPDMENMEEEVEHIISLGLHGVKLHPDTQHFNTDSAKAMKLYECIENRLPLLIHCGDYRYDYSHPRRLAKVLDSFKNLTVVAAHLGGWSIFEQAVPYLKKRRCYMDISSSMPFIGIKRVSEYIKIYGADRLMFGSDFPMWNPVSEYENFMKIKMARNEREKILWKNAAKVFNIDCSDYVLQKKVLQIQSV